jgi:superfamily I DNA and/or RNA helicase
VQLPPFTEWKKAADYKYNVSLLQRLAQRPGVAADHNLMVMQYRMHPSIATIVSDVFYGGRLTTAPIAIAERRRKVPVKFCNVDGSEQSYGTSFRNLQEVRKVIEIVRQEVMHAPLEPQTAVMLGGNGKRSGIRGSSTALVSASGDSSIGGNGLLQSDTLIVDSHAHVRGKPLHIDVIAFHKPQVFAIKDALESSGLMQMARIDVTTVDSMQGRCVTEL